MRGLAVLVGLVLFVGVHFLDELISGPGIASRIVAGLVVFIAVVAVASFGLIRAERRRRNR
jgi:hypothetical protein